MSRAHHAAYVASWLKVLKEAKRAIFTTAAKAQQAIDYLQSLQSVPVNDAEAEPVAYRGSAGGLSKSAQRKGTIHVWILAIMYLS
jgi:antirestriction protein ArdC